MAQDTVKIGLVGVGRGGPSSYHARSFSSIINGFEPTKVPKGWPVHLKRARGAQVAVVWDEDLDAARKLARVFSIPRVAKSMKELMAGVDGVIVVDDITMSHQEKAIPFLREGIPTFIDKPLSGDIREATKIIELADKKGALLMSTSALRYAKEVETAWPRIKKCGPLDLASAICQGKYMAAENIIHYGIHILELAYSVIGPGAVAVQNVGETGKNVVKIDFQDGRVLILSVFPEISQLFQLNLYGRKGAAAVQVEDWDYFYWKMLTTYIQMVRSGKLPVRLSETLEIIKVLISAKASLMRGGKRIRID